MNDREIPDLMRGAFDKINDLVPSGSADLNRVHVAVYERCQVSRDLDMVVAQELYVLCRISSISESCKNHETVIQTIDSIRQLTQDHIEYYSD